MILYKEILVVLGGRNSKNENLPTDILNLKNLQWSTLPGIDRFRHASWCLEGDLFTFGGFQVHEPDRPTNILDKRNILKLLEPLPLLKKQIANLEKNGDKKIVTSIHQSMHTKYDLNENVLVAKTKSPNIVKYYPLNSLQRERDKLNSKINISWTRSSRIKQRQKFH